MSEVERLLGKIYEMKQELESLGCKVSITVKPNVDTGTLSGDPVYQDLKEKAQVLQIALEEHQNHRPAMDSPDYRVWFKVRSDLLSEMTDVHWGILDRIKESRESVIKTGA